MKAFFIGLIFLNASFCKGQNENINLSGIFLDKDEINQIYQPFQNYHAIKSHHFVFFKNGYCFYNDAGISSDSVLYEKREVKRILSKDCYSCSSWGKFKIKYNVISAHLRYQFYARGMRIKFYDVHFDGIVQNDNTIINWKMIPPYPNPNKNWNENFEDLKEPKTLIFISFPAKKLIDSNNVWINQYEGSYWKL